MTEKLAKDVEIPRQSEAASGGPQIELGRESMPASQVEGPAVGRSSAAERPDAAMEGLPIEDYAERQDMSLSDAWRKVRMGQLVSRSVKGRLFVYPDGEAPKPQVAEGGEQGLPPLPDRIGASGRDAAMEPSNALVSLASQESGGSEVALLLDHLSLAKEENREILRLTEASLSKVTHLTDELVKLKDAVIEAKDAQLAAYQREIDQQKQAIRKLLQEKEDLEMLAKTMLDG